MPRLSIWMVRTALVNLLIGFTFGALLLAHKGIGLHPMLWRLLPLHIEFLLIGWTLQLAMGVAYWILPRFFSKRGRVGLAWLAYLLLNSGLCCMVISVAVPAWGAVAAVGRGLEALAAVAFALHAWPRIKPMSEVAAP